MSRPSDAPEATPKKRGPHRLLIGVLIALAVIVGGIVWWVDQGRHLFFPKNWAAVEAGQIYRSGRIHRGLIEDTLAEHEIALVIDLTGDDGSHPDTAAEREACTKLGIRRVELPGLNGYGTGDLQSYVFALKELLASVDADQPVLVHCAGGSERAGATVAFYRMLFQGRDGASAWDEYVRYRHKPPERPDLPDYVNANLPELVTRLQRVGVEVTLPDPVPVFGPAQAPSR